MDRLLDLGGKQEVKCACNICRGGTRRCESPDWSPSPYAAAEELRLEECAEGLHELVAESGLGLKEVLERLEWAAIQLALRNHGTQTGAAAALGVGAGAMHARIHSLKARYGEG